MLRIFDSEGDLNLPVAGGHLFCVFHSIRFSHGQMQIIAGNNRKEPPLCRKHTRGSL